MHKIENNFAFIDGQNVQRGVIEMGWRLDWNKFRVYLSEKLGVSRAYLFLGYIKKYHQLYVSLRRAGYVLIFKKILILRNFSKIKGNIDAELVLQAMIDYQSYDRAVIVTSDGDFTCLVDYLYQNNKLASLLSVQSKKCSHLLMKASREKLIYMSDFIGKIEYKK